MTNQDKPDVGSRLGSMIVDHFIMTMVASLFAIPGMIAGIGEAMSSVQEPGTMPTFGISYFGLLGLALYLCKDSIQGRSPAKRLIKLQVINHKTGAVASPLQCFVRNIFCIIWMIEVFVVMASPGRRIGDRVAGTRVIKFDPELEQPKVDYGQVAIALALSYGLMLAVSLPLYL